MGHTQDLRDFGSVLFRNGDQLDGLPGYEFVSMAQLWSWRMEEGQEESGNQGLPRRLKKAKRVPADSE